MFFNLIEMVIKKKCRLCKFSLDITRKYNLSKLIGVDFTLREIDLTPVHYLSDTGLFTPREIESMVMNVVTHYDNRKGGKFVYNHNRLPLPKEVRRRATDKLRVLLRTPIFVYCGNNKDKLVIAIIKR